MSAGLTPPIRKDGLAMSHRSLAVYFLLLSLFCAAIIVGAKMLGQQGAYLAQVYMLTPALAAILTRAFFYPPRFRDANLRLGKVTDYVKFWALSLGIIALMYAVLTPFGVVRWDFTGKVFLDRLADQLAAAGQDMEATLPPGFTPQMMLMIYFVGGLTVFNVLPGIITGFGEEFGHRGFMFPLLYRIRPWIGLVGGGLIWFAWHLPLTLVIPQGEAGPAWQTGLNAAISAIGSVFTFVYLAYIYVKSRSIFVAAVAHITMNNAAASFSYFGIIGQPLLANLALVLIMIAVVAVLHYRGELAVLKGLAADR